MSNEQAALLAKLYPYDSLVNVTPSPHSINPEVGVFELRKGAKKISLLPSLSKSSNKVFTFPQCYLCRLSIPMWRLSDRHLLLN